MKKIFLLFTITILLTSFIFAAMTGSAIENNKNQIQNTDVSSDRTQIKLQKKILTRAEIAKATQIKNRLRVASQNNECPEKCECTGSVTKCELANGTRQMTIRAGKSGNTIVQVKGTNMSTKVALYQADGEVYGVFKNNQTKLIKIMPDEVRQKIREKIKARLENETIDLDEDGEYKHQARKRARLLGFIPVKEKVVTRIDSETGDIIRTKTSWGGFLARDIEEEEELEEEPSIDEVIE